MNIAEIIPRDIMPQARHDHTVVADALAREEQMPQARRALRVEVDSNVELCRESRPMWTA
eukprot:1031057-Amphidinium_carterae.1